MKTLASSTAPFNMAIYCRNTNVSSFTKGFASFWDLNVMLLVIVDRNVDIVSALKWLPCTNACMCAVFHCICICMCSLYSN